MIAINVFTIKEVNEIKEKYKNILRYKRDTLIYDDLHVMYINLTYYYSLFSTFDEEWALFKSFRAEHEYKYYKDFEIFYFPMRAVIMVNEIIKRFEIPLMSVFTLGSWRGGEYLGDEAEYFKVLMNLNSKLKPEFVITNQRFLDDNPLWYKCAVVKNFNMGDAVIYRIKHRNSK